MKTTDNFCILPLLAYPAHSVGLAWQEENSAKFVWPLSFFFSVFYCCWFAKPQVTELWVVCPTAPLFWSVLQQKLEKPVHLLFFFFLVFLSPIGSCSLYACRQGGAYLSCGRLPYKNWGCIFHYPRVFLASYRLWWMLCDLNSTCSPRNVFRSLFYFSSGKGKVFECLQCTPFK